MQADKFLDILTGYTFSCSIPTSPVSQLSWELTQKIQADIQKYSETRLLRTVKGNEKGTCTF